MEKKEYQKSITEINHKGDKATQEELFSVLKLVAPGTNLRAALDGALKGGKGGLMVVENESTSSLFDGGFWLNTKFSPQKMIELSKMDGAIILSRNAKKILHANTTLHPDQTIMSKETGTRHKAAERTAKQFNTIVIAISERKNKITLFFKDSVYFLEHTSEILRRATENLQILEKQKEIFNDLISHLNVLEITNLTTTNDVCNVLQTLENIRRISENVKRYLIELGKEGIIVSMRLKELIRNLYKEREFLLKDYFGQKHNRADELLRNIHLDSLLETSTISRALFGEAGDKSVTPLGLRILGKTNLPEKEIRILVNSFGNLDRIFEISKEDFLEVFDNEEKINSITRDLRNLKEKILVGKTV